MATPPTRAAYAVPASGNYSSAPASFTTAAFNVTAGDLIVVAYSIEADNSWAPTTPSASGGTVTWTQRVNQAGGGGAGTQSAAACYTGVVGATATGITVTVNRPTSNATLFWGMSATVWTAHGGVGVVFSGNNGTGSGAPSVAATCSANSGVQCLINDWNAIDGTTRTWLTINGAAESESLYFRNTVNHAAYGGYRTDTGAAGSITQGLSTPSTMRWVMAGVEILGTGAAAAIPPSLVMAPRRP